MHIVIIGGGVAGIAAARTVLADAGHTVTLVEATDRYGGRALSDTLSIPGFVLEKGATQIQDPDINPLVAVAARLGFATYEEPDRPGWFRVHGALGWTTESLAYAPVEHVVDQLAASYDQTKNQPNAVVAPPFPQLGQDQLLALLNTPLGPIVASADPWSYLAADHARESSAELGPNTFVNQGIGTLVEAFGAELATDFGARFTVRFTTPVQRVAWSAEGVQVTGADLDIAADGCIVTVPVSLLAADAIEFAPPLPAGHRTALRALKLGSYKKLAVTLTAVPDAIAVGNVYCIADVPNRGCWEFFRTGANPDVLFAQTAGDFAARLDAMDDAAVFTLLHDLLQPTYAQPLTFGPQRAITNWTQAPFTQGAYSYTAPLGGDPTDPTALGARTALAAPLGRMRIAGEATDLTYFGTLQAAYFEGVRAATELLA